MEAGKQITDDGFSMRGVQPWRARFDASWWGFYPLAGMLCSANSARAVPGRKGSDLRLFLRNNKRNKRIPLAGHLAGCPPYGGDITMRG